MRNQSWKEFEVSLFLDFLFIFLFHLFFSFYRLGIAIRLFDIYEILIYQFALLLFKFLDNLLFIGIIQNLRIPLELNDIGLQATMYEGIIELWYAWEIIFDDSPDINQ